MMLLKLFHQKIISLTRIGSRYYGLWCHLNKIHFYWVVECITEKVSCKSGREKDRSERERDCGWRCIRILSRVRKYVALISD